MSVNNETSKEAPAKEIVFPTAAEMKARIETETAARGKAYRKAHPQFTKNLMDFLASVHEGTSVLVNSEHKKQFTLEETRLCLEGLGYQIQASANGGMIVGGGLTYPPFWIRWVPFDTI